MGNDLTALTDLSASEVSLVTRGANKKRRFPVFKAEEEMNDDMQEVLKAVLETEVDDESKLAALFEKAGLSDKAQSAVKGMLRLGSAFKDEPGMKEALGKLAALMGGETSKAKGDDDEEDPKPAKKAKKPEADDEGDDVPPKKEKARKSADAAPPDAEALAKLPAEIKKQVEAVFKAQGEQVQKALDRADEAERILKSERDERQRQELITKAERELSHVPGASSEELGKMFKSLYDVNPEVAEAQWQRMKAASEALKKSALFTERGYGGGGEGVGGGKSAWDRVQKLATGIVQKSENPLLTKEKAVALVLKNNPDLYREYLAEHPAQVQPGM